MANELDELNGPVNEVGRAVRVIERQLPVTVGVGSCIFEILLWCLGLLPGLIFLFMKVSARNYFRQLQQKLQADASRIDNYLEQRVVILQNLAQLLNKAIDLDKDVMKQVAAYRGGIGGEGDSARNVTLESIDRGFRALMPHIEAYPELRAHTSIQEAIRQNAQLQQEITAARELYNDTVAQWNHDIYMWPTKMIVAARAGYTTRIPFTASAEVRRQAAGTFF